ncbi:DUF3341 domain-containing protein [Falsiroseomonas oryzae]|uniref:DUF3341 domain-containing protein n=1 Tax=Falsiroseomonas oryzae TaxID=2766473 RepID=UPI0022EA46FE|nr:DUF3341 domain-containing protein [Roseomonas sp. MO-31]
MSDLHGVIGAFSDKDDLLEALRTARAEGWTSLDAFTPHPVPEAADLLGARPGRVAWIAMGAGAFGALLAYATQWWLSVHDYPINVGGRPLHAWPAFLPATTIVAILWAAVASLLGMLVANGLPRLSHPVLAAPGFLRASEDRFFLMIAADDPRFDAGQARHLLQRSGALRVSDLPAQ